MRILSKGFPKLPYFHLLTHALFKTLLFICTGVVIHSIKLTNGMKMWKGNGNTTTLLFPLKALEI